ncbi:expressed unknown protein [Seminavis robusta]|uniref:RING-type domain-containing protein n=1 Tax=Seminavis robusta TaxID=568900 RepID=A0A9N8EQH0_9STRA|nr:expressed unknown protein [Seminavis robusta]|eukprot:Sro1410_g270310.1 n/a (252) ;mRNA; f:19672-20427
MMRIKTTILLISLLLVVLHPTCLAFSTSEAHFTSVTSGKRVDGNSFFRISLLSGNRNNNKKDGTSTQENTPAFTSEDEKFLSQMMLIGFNVFSMILIFIRCYYHWVMWRRAHRKEVDVLKDIRRKAEKKLQDIEEQQKWKFWSQQQQHQEHPTPHITKDYTGQSCPICWSSFQTMDESNNNNNLDDAGLPSEDTLLLSPNKQRMVGSDGKPIKKLPCGHTFDYTCAVEWLVTLHKKNMDSPLTCPVCREAF